MNFIPLDPLHGRILANIAQQSLGDFPWERAWNAHEFAEILANPAYKGWLMEDHGQPFGFILISIIIDQADIVAIAILPPYQHQGWGKKLWQHTLSWAVSHSIKAFFLEVAEVNEIAIAFYQSLGFSLIRKRKGYYRTPRGDIDALLMKIDLPLPLD